jgi:hypothetical protein
MGNTFHIVGNDISYKECTDTTCCAFNSSMQIYDMIRNTSDDDLYSNSPYNFTMSVLNSLEDDNYILKDLNVYSRRGHPEEYNVCKYERRIDKRKYNEHELFNNIDIVRGFDYNTRLHIRKHSHHTGPMKNKLIRLLCSPDDIICHYCNHSKCIDKCPNSDVFQQNEIVAP